MNKQLEAAKFELAAKTSHIEVTMYKLFTIICQDVEFLLNVQGEITRSDTSAMIDEHLAKIQEQLKAL